MVLLDSHLLAATALASSNPLLATMLRRRFATDNFTEQCTIDREIILLLPRRAHFHVTFRFNCRIVHNSWRYEPSVVADGGWSDFGPTREDIRLVFEEMEEYPDIARSSDPRPTRYHTPSPPSRKRRRE